MPSIIKDMKIISSMASIINGLTILKSALTVGIIVFTVFEALSTFSRMDSNELLKG